VAVWSGAGAPGGYGRRGGGGGSWGTESERLLNAARHCFALKELPAEIPAPSQKSCSSICTTHSLLLGGAQWGRVSFIGP